MKVMKMAHFGFVVFCVEVELTLKKTKNIIIIMNNLAFQQTYVHKNPSTRS
jgi:hypothetical protein